MLSAAAPTIKDGRSLYSSTIESNSAGAAVPRLCPRHVVWIQAKSQSGVKLYPKGCGTYACPVCGPKKAKKLARHLDREAGAHGLRIFLTLNMKPKEGASPREETRRLMRGWDNMNRALKHGKMRLNFIWFKDLTKKGTPHLHMLIDSYVHYVFIRRTWRRVVGGGGYWIERAKKIRNVAAYCAKYLLNALGRATLLRRWGSCRKIHLLDKSIYESAEIRTWIEPDTAIIRLMEQGYFASKIGYFPDGSLAFMRLGREEASVVCG